MIVSLFMPCNIETVTFFTNSLCLPDYLMVFSQINSKLHPFFSECIAVVRFIHIIWDQKKLSTFFFFLNNTFSFTVEVMEYLKGTACNHFPCLTCMYVIYLYIYFFKTFPFVQTVSRKVQNSWAGQSNKWVTFALNWYPIFTILSLFPWFANYLSIATFDNIWQWINNVLYNRNFFSCR